MRLALTSPLEIPIFVATPKCSAILRTTAIFYEEVFCRAFRLCRGQPGASCVAFLRFLQLRQWFPRNRWHSNMGQAGINGRSGGPEYRGPHLPRPANEQRHADSPI